MGKTLLVVAEARHQALRQVSFETLQAAHMAAQDNDRIATVLLGNAIESLSKQLAPYGVEDIYTVSHETLQRYQPQAYFSALKHVIERVAPEAIFFGHTAIGKDLAPQVAAEYNAGQISDVTDIENKNGHVRFTRPIYAGKAFETKGFTDTPWVVTVRPNNIAPAEPDPQHKAAIHSIDIPTPSLTTIIEDVVTPASGKIDLTEASIVIAGGRGVKSAEGFQPLEELADVLGGALGASRGACDAGYCNYALQIGQTGKVVTPDLYIACGISGAIQHLAGMNQSKVIVAVNKDPDAPIFQVADYGIVDDLFEVVPLLTEELKQRLQPDR